MKPQTREATGGSHQGSCEAVALSGGSGRQPQAQRSLQTSKAKVTTQLSKILRLQTPSQAEEAAHTPCPGHPSHPVPSRAVPWPPELTQSCRPVSLGWIHTPHQTQPPIPPHCRLVLLPGCPLTHMLVLPFLAPSPPLPLPLEVLPLDPIASRKLTTT